MKKCLTFVLVAFLLVFTFQALPVPKSESSTAVATVTGQREAANTVQPIYKKGQKFATSADRAAKIKPGTKIFENSAQVLNYSSGFV